jgi:hypothetical protein
MKTKSVLSVFLFRASLALAQSPAQRAFSDVETLADDLQGLDTLGHVTGVHQ